MYSVDATLNELIQNNWLTMTAIGLLARGLAKTFEWPWLNKIVDSLAAAFGVFRPSQTKQKD